jgi:hypothetical protein
MKYNLAHLSIYNPVDQTLEIVFISPRGETTIILGGEITE